MPDPDDSLIEVEIVTYDDSDTEDQFCERYELMRLWMGAHDYLMGRCVVGKS